ncbi:MAG: HRDC domain-containing protein [Elusimicrobia bacterium]|nr:HRDC domain-containing protein [Elusimicrobiota bacterium]
MPYVFIDRQADFDALVTKLLTHKYVSIDTESNSMYVYREQLCLLQLASEHLNAVVDSLSVDVRGLAPVFANRHIEKIFHSAEADIKTLKASLPVKFENIFDVMIAAKYLGLKRCGLENMVKEHIGVDLNKKFQKADWGRRPLMREMLDYAVGDVLYLHKLRVIFAEELRKKGRLEEIQGQFAEIAALEPGRNAFDENGFFRVHQARQLNGRGLAVLRELYIAREKAAMERNKPPFKIISEDLMFRLAIAPKEALEKLSIFKGVTGYVLINHGPWIKDAVHAGMKAPEVQFPKRNIAPEKRLHFEGIRERFKLLKAWRLETANKRNMLPEAVLGNDLLEKAALINPKTAEELRDIKGFGLEKFSLYAEEMIKALRRKQTK